MSKCLLITRPNHDITTNYLYFWSTIIIQRARAVGLKVIDLKAERANKKVFVAIIQKVDPDIVLLNGHGNHQSVAGQDNEVLLQAHVNDSLLSNKIVYAVSCSSGRTLGKSSVQAGAKAYIGYSEDFIFIIDESKISRPLEDKTARLFLEPSNQVSIAILKGHSAGESHRRSKLVFRKTIEKFLTSDARREDKEILPYLVWDMRHQVCLGDTEARL